jgi:hypothetical protein
VVSRRDNPFDYDRLIVQFSSEKNTEAAPLERVSLYYQSSTIAKDRRREPTTEVRELE